MNALILLSIAGFIVSLITCVYVFTYCLCRIAAQSDAGIEYPARLPEPKERTK